MKGGPFINAALLYLAFKQEDCVSLRNTLSRDGKIWKKWITLNIFSKKEKKNIITH